MRNAIVLGTGGHCRVILSMLRSGCQHDVTAIIELEVPRLGEKIMGIPVMPDFNYLTSLSVRNNIDVFLAIGNNNARKHWWKKVKALKLPLPNLVSPHALVDDTASMGESNVICPRAVIGPLAQLGDNNLINTSAIVEHEVCIGHDCHLAPSSTIAGRCRLDNLCLVGAGATIIDSISVASRSIIGAGATLIRNVEIPGGTYIGTPARRRGSVK